MATASMPSSVVIDDDVLYEVANGEVVEIEPTGAYATWIASMLLQAFVGQRKHGQPVAEMLFDFSRQVGKKKAA